MRYAFLDPLGNSTICNAEGMAVLTIERYETTPIPQRSKTWEIPRMTSPSARHDVQRAEPAIRYLWIQTEERRAWLLGLTTHTPWLFKLQRTSMNTLKHKYN
uniref:Uncharacterized protein n=1 Tax=Heliothis virescens TaxID=7102 RepID=A0A2A4J7Y7_HELVI